ncbi:MAG: glycosyl hydrolase 115 family protein [Muribaculum sp.]|nr:glycosyl hydrolase 115 family protein [Muribaculaceae bacterium]MCM1081286.1 glycosyl hydrolase 115 family protein [Muribaculum sp.]
MNDSNLCLKSIFVATISSLFILSANAKDVVWFDNSKPVSVYFDSETDLVVGTAFDMFCSDIQAVTGTEAVKSNKKNNATIIAAQLNRLSKSQRKVLERAGVPVAQLDTLIDGFDIRLYNGKILVSGTNGRGTAYGLLELSRLAGVSPWIWWGDVIPVSKNKLTIPADYQTTQGASVEFRGIFINDEDWSIRPWSATTFEPNKSGTIGPKTNKEVFKLLMRLRANAVWPAMHPGTEAFFKNPDNKLVADSCGIAVGTSHCEPLLRNNVDEWDVKERGAFNYITNRDAVQNYWIERLQQVRNSSGGNIFTIGMRGIHDGSMEGVKTTKEKFDALQLVINDQQQLLSIYIGAPEKQMQVFVPYKEVLDLYELGLAVPEYVTLMWCDDNYGYITRLSNVDEQKRIGGGGIYYHLSYWGRPHDYLWLTTTQPGLIYNELTNAYNHNVRKLWIANVHDPKTAAYDLELFLDLAWNINSVESENVGKHLESWLTTNFGRKAAKRLYPALRKYYQLCAQRRPEFMGWSQVEVDKKLFNRGLSPVSNTEFSFSEFGSEADRYMNEFLQIAAVVDSVETEITPQLHDAFFAAIKYPVASAANNAVKMLEAQRSRQYASGSDNIALIAAAKSQNAYQNIRRLTEYYNNKMTGGKWQRSMDMSPRNLPVAGAPALPVLLTDSEIEHWLAQEPSAQTQSPSHYGIITSDASSYRNSNGKIRAIDMLGHSNRAVELGKGSSLTYEFSVDEPMKEPQLTIAMIPTHSTDNGDIRYSVTIDNGTPIEFSLKEPFRSERWKLNVLRGQALRTVELPELSIGSHTLKITALDKHIVVDQWMIDTKKGRKFYLLPTGIQ